MRRLGWLLVGSVLAFVGGFLFGVGWGAASVLAVGAGVVVMAVGAVVAAGGSTSALSVGSVPPPAGVARLERGGQRHEGV